LGHMWPLGFKLSNFNFIHLSSHFHACYMLIPWFDHSSNILWTTDFDTSFC
jgi:hypothetical protein